LGGAPISGGLPDREAFSIRKRDFAGCFWLFQAIIFRWLLFGAGSRIYGFISDAWSILAVFE